MVQLFFIFIIITKNSLYPCSSYGVLNVYTQLCFTVTLLDSHPDVGFLRYLLAGDTCIASTLTVGTTESVASLLLNWPLSCKLHLY